MDIFGGGGVTVDLDGEVGAAMSSIDRGIDRLIRLTTHADSPVSRGAIVRLIQLGPAALGRLAATLHGRRDGPLRLRAIQIIRFIGRDHPQSALVVLGAACPAVEHPEDVRAIEAAWRNICADAERRLAANTLKDEEPVAARPRRSRAKAGRSVVPTIPPTAASPPPPDPASGIVGSAPDG